MFQLSRLVLTLGLNEGGKPEDRSKTAGRILHLQGVYSRDPRHYWRRLIFRNQVQARFWFGRIQGSPQHALPCLNSFQIQCFNVSRD
jgi:hypothetical protein